MKRLVTFDVPGVSAYEIVDQIYPLRSMPGVKSVELLSAVEGAPKFCLVVETDDAQDAAVKARMDAMRRENEGYLASYTDRAFKKVG